MAGPRKGVDPSSQADLQHNAVTFRQAVEQRRRDQEKANPHDDPAQSKEAAERTQMADSFGAAVKNLAGEIVTRRRVSGFVPEIDFLGGKAIVTFLEKQHDEIQLLKEFILREAFKGIAKKIGSSFGKMTFSAEVFLPSKPEIVNLSQAEIDAIAEHLGHSGEALKKAISHVKDLQEKGVPLNLPKRPDKDHIVLPQVASELYRNRAIRPELGRKENIVEFVKRVWQSEMDAGLLTRVALRRLDPGAETAVENWLSRRPLPPELNIPTKKHLNDAALDRAEIPIKDVPRLSRALDRRRVKGPASSPT